MDNKTHNKEMWELENQLKERDEIMNNIKENIQDKNNNKTPESSKILCDEISAIIERHEKRSVTWMKRINFWKSD